MLPTNPIVTNTPEITVSELSGALKRTLEDRFGFVRVRGEVSGYRGPHGSGHVYFALKDSAARLDAIIWKTTFLRMRFKPSEGIEVIASGKITTFAGKSSYQIVVDSMEPAGVGALMALLEARRKQFAAEGLFENARKRLLPFLPRTIGVVTSPSGAVIRDILHRLADRFPIRVLVWPVRVQGETSAEEIASAITGFDALTGGLGIPRPDVLIVARGGGSLEDLWGFNEEVVIRAAAACEIPLVSAVGHETDWTLLDQVADLRAPTPTAAAELCVPVRSELSARVATLATRASGALIRKRQHDRASLRSAIRGLPSGDEVLAASNQRKDRAVENLRSRIGSHLAAGRLRIAGLARGLARFSPHVQFARASERAIGIVSRLRIVGRTSAVTAQHLLQRAQGDLQYVRQRAMADREQLLATTRQRWLFCFVEAKRLQMERHLMRERAWANLRRIVLDLMGRRSSHIVRLAQIFGAVNYKAVLGRGYALIQDKSGGAISGVSAARTAGDLTIKFADGEVFATAQVLRSARRRKKQAHVIEQQSLF